MESQLGRLAPGHQLFTEIEIRYRRHREFSGKRRIPPPLVVK
jgi:hypothetical protein